MGKPQIAIRLSPSLLQELNNYVELTGTSKTDVVVSAISQYIGCADNMPLNQRMAELETKVEVLIKKTKLLEL
ncbi:DNA-binding domain-containing protein [Dolichospermum heterosporum]|jgi:predicted DNA-binding protein|uniref:DNA-binding domain-containing protein n=1 Tax=Dolichospermum heterosporum TAC447 TaxID=747523 RepID=A0ABY5LUG8_9CYAN|nr:DNA-binding domain-containing protein [Dolichospermum heterosporum]UUO14930.1 DNA-binding domain-containing protein [Dolichospermum heterosporum TAC447]